MQLPAIFRATSRNPTGQSRSLHPNHWRDDLHVVRLSLGVIVVALFSGLCAIRANATERARIETDLSGLGWHLWLDRAAKWQDDTLYFPTPSLDKLPVNPPTRGWEVLRGAEATPVAVPGTVEEYLQTVPGPEGDITGVSWWTRSLAIPASSAPRRVLLRFESLRLRAEIFVNRKLVGYDLVGNSPVEVDITSAVVAGQIAELAVRVTDPGGNFDWRDSSAMRWGRYSLPLSHGFGGITGRVRLVVCDPVYVADLSVQNTPAITDANAAVTIRNDTGAPQTRDVELRVIERNEPTREVFRTTLRAVALPPGESVVPIKISAPDAALWDPDHPNLHVCAVTLRDAGIVTDFDRRVFGFRWFAPENMGTDAVFRLNGKRFVARSAISWGFWPVNGIYPTAALAKKQILTAKAFGLNMLNFHRAIGNPIVFEKANELGLLYFEEPGAHKSATRDPFGHALSREKFLRMVRRDRSHPSLVIYNLINEWDSRNPNPDPVEIARHRADLAAAYEIDPSRVLLHTSAWARAPEIDDPAKLHFRPFDPTPHLRGWYDVHHAGGPAVWNESLYRSPVDYYLRTDNRKEIVFWGEEGALSTPPRLELIKAALDASPHAGWDGGVYREWFRAFDDFLTRKNLRTAFPTVDAFTTSLGNISLYHQGRRIENIRLSDVSDGYAINGWEAQIIENHSGVVDCFRNPKGDPAILAHYNQPLYVAVKVRNTIAQPGATVLADFFAVNERDLRGPHQLLISLRDAVGTELAAAERAVALRGGEVYGELLAAEIGLEMPAGFAGLARVEASLVGVDGVARARGRDNVWVIDWRSAPVTGNGAVWESGRLGRDFLREGKGRAIPEFARGLDRLDWIVAARAPLEGEPVIVPATALRWATGEAGLRATFYSDQKFQHAVHRRTDATIAYAVDDGAAPDPALSVMKNYAVRWEGVVTPVEEGRHTFVVRTNGRVRLFVDDKEVIALGSPRGPQNNRATLDLRAGVPLRVRLEFLAGNTSAQCELGWILPEADPAIPAQILERVRRDGTTLVVLERADAWMTLLAGEPQATVKYRGSFRVGKTWLGGNHFAREHALFRGLPVDAGMDWPYQNVVRNGDERLGLLLEGEELAAGCYHSFPMQLGTVAGVFPHGKGHVIFSTLDLISNLNAPDDPADVAKKLFCNALAHAFQLAQPATPESQRH